METPVALLSSLSSTPKLIKSTKIPTTCIIQVYYFARWSGSEGLWWVCLCVCLSVRQDIPGIARAIFTKFFSCMLPMSVARSSSGTFTIGRIAYRRERGDGSAQRWRSVIRLPCLSPFMFLAFLLPVCNWRNSCYLLSLYCRTFLCWRISSRHVKQLPSLHVNNDTRQLILYAYTLIITFRVRRSRCEMYIGHGRLCVCVFVCLSVPRRIPTLPHGPGCKLGKWQECPLLGGFGIVAWDNIEPNAKCQRVLVLALCLLIIVIMIKENFTAPTT